MNWRKHILVGALGANSVLYLSTALWMAVTNTKHTELELTHYATLTSEVLDLEFKRMRRLSRDLLVEHYEKKRTLKEKLFWPETFLKMASISIIQNGQLRNLTDLPHTPSIPIVLLKDTNYGFIYYDTKKQPYVALAFDEVNYGFDQTVNDATFIASFELPIAKWQKAVSAINDVDISIIEQNENMEPEVLFSSLSNENLVQLIEHSPLRSAEDYEEYSSMAFRDDRAQTVFKATLTGTKHIVFPYVLSKNKYVKQVIYYSLPLPEFYSINVPTMSIIIASLFTTLVTLLLSGLYLVKHLDKQTK